MEMARTMLNDSQLSDKLCGQAVHTYVHFLNRGLLRNDSDKTPYELWMGDLQMLNISEYSGANAT